MLIADELLLFALDPDKGTPVNSSRQPLTTSLSGALVAELGLLGRLVMDGKRFRAVGKPPPHPLLAEVHGKMNTMKGRRAVDQLRRLDKAVGGVWDRVADGLVDQNVLGRERHRVVVVPVTRHPVRRTEIRDAVVRRVRGAAAGSGPIEPRTATLLALAGPSRLLEVVAPDRSERKHARERIEAATEQTPVAPVVLKVLQEAQAAVTAAIGASIAAGAAGAGSS